MSMITYYLDDPIDMNAVTVDACFDPDVVLMSRSNFSKPTFWSRDVLVTRESIHKVNSVAICDDEVSLARSLGASIMVTNASQSYSRSAFNTDWMVRNNGVRAYALGVAWVQDFVIMLSGKRAASGVQEDMAYHAASVPELMMAEEFKRVGHVGWEVL